jgi:glycerol-3-phosphate cytidylyltransferase-like family protein
MLTTQCTVSRANHVTHCHSCEQVCDFVSKGANVFWIEEQQVPFAVLGDQWLSFDDDNSLRIKVTPS